MSVKISIADLIGALRAGLATKEELQAHFGCTSLDLHKPLGNLVTRKLGERYLEDGKAAYRLTVKGKAWKTGAAPQTHGGGEELKTESEGGEADVRAIPAPEYDPNSVALGSRGVEMSLLNVIADIRAAIGDTGQLMLDELAPRIRQVQSAANEVQAARHVHAQNEKMVLQLGKIRTALSPFVVEVDPAKMTEAELAEAAAAAIREGLERIFSRNSGSDDLANAQALADKLQHLLDSKTHECEALRKALDGRTCAGEPDLETVPLHELTAAVRLFLDEGQSLAIYRGGDVGIEALGREFIVADFEANSVLDAASLLARNEAAA